MTQKTKTITRKPFIWLTTVIIVPLVIILSLPLPDPLFDDSYSTVLEASEGELLGAIIADDGQWRFPQSDSVPFKFKQAILLFEDEYFYQHPGVNPISLTRAIRQNLQAGKVVSGGSTLSMQLIRVARGNQPRNLWQKAYETLLTLKLEMVYSKEEILAAYVSHAPFGGNVVGLSAASWRYYGRPADQLSWAEAASLAVLPNDPASIFPGRNEAPYKAKRDRLLDKIMSKGLIDSTTNKLSKAERLPLKPKPMPALAQKLLFRAAGEGMKGKTVRSTIDYKLQRKVKTITEKHSEHMSGNQIHNVAALVIDVETGHALSYVGNTDRKEGDHGQHVDIVTSLRSPGSLLKPILYAAAMDQGGLMPQELLPDVPLFYKGFAPKNFDKKFHGVIPADEAVARSLNVPFVYLLQEYGYENFHQKLTNLGITSLNKEPGHYGLSLILGGAEASLWDLTGMYASLVRTLNRYNQRTGEKKYRESDIHENSFLPKIKDESAPQQHGEIRVEAIWQMLQSMQKLNRPEEWTGWERFSSARSIAWKTGTSYGFRDGWAIGMDQKYVVGVWLGNADGEGRPGLTGVKAAAPLMLKIFDQLSPSAFKSGITSADQTICTKSGLLATALCEETKIKNLPEYMVAGKLCHYHQKIFLDQSGKFQVNSSCYPVTDMKSQNWFTLSAVEGWYYKSYNAQYIEPPKFMSSCDAAEKGDFMEFIYPKQFSRVYVPREIDGSKGQAVFEVAHRDPSTTIFWHLDDEYLGSTTRNHQMGINTAAGAHTISLVDEDGNLLEQRFEVISEGS